VAGYDFTFYCPKRFRKDAQAFLRFFCAAASRMGLDAKFRTYVRPRRRVECYVQVDGHLGTMQTLDKGIGRISLTYIRALGRPLALSDRVVLPCLKANREGVRGITDLISEDVRTFRRMGFTAAQSAFSVSSEVQEKANLIEPVNRLDRAVKTIVELKVAWFSEGEPNERVVILADQAMEDLLKARLGLPERTSRGFGAVVELAKENGLLSPWEAYRLRRFHKTRNRAQHRGGRVVDSTVRSMLELYIRLLNKTLV